MKFNPCGQVIVNEQDIFQGLYSGKITNLSSLNIDDCTLVEQFNLARAENADHIPALSVFSENNLSIEEFDKENQANWFMPAEYKNMDIAKYLIDQCTSIEEMERVALELELFYQHNMVDVLKYLKYLVDTMRSNDIVWGVGRGSSVASYCLYLLKVHRVDSIKYGLDIHEFLKES